MHTLEIHNYIEACRISEYCMKSLTREQWDIKLLNLYPPRYQYSFESDKLRTMAALVK